jgi:A/G-specific adenine glycosylase
MVGSISSIAFNLPVAAVDGNVIRVVTRLLALEDDAATAAVRHKISDWVQERFPIGQAKDYTQAIMELGALICTPKRPQCVQCPLQGLCLGLQSGPERFPVKSKKIKVPEERRIVVIVHWHGRRLLARRPQHGLMAGFWEYPHFVAVNGTDGAILAGDWSQHYLGKRLTFSFVKKMTHIYSHLRWNLEIYQADWQTGVPLYLEESGWFSAEEESRLSRVAFVRKLRSE